MPQSLAEIYLHVVFSTKGRHPFLHDRAIREQVHNYLFGTCKNLGCPPLRVGGVEDHVHIACRLGKSISISNLIKELMAGIRRERLEAFTAWAAQHITGDEKGEAQIFLDRLFQAFGHAGCKDAGGTLEHRVRKDKE